MTFHPVQQYEITAVPTVIVLRASDGGVISKTGRADVQSKGPAAADEWLAKA